VSLGKDEKIKVIDSHTGGEPTRIVIEGGPEIGGGPLIDRVKKFRNDHDDFRRAVIHEPRGADVLIGGVLCEPTEPDCVTGVIFFNNVDYLGMCGHGTIGLVQTLYYLGRIEPGRHKIETPVGVVTVVLHEDCQVTVQNVPSFRYRADVELSVEGYESVCGDIAWGGNWFFLVKDHPFEIKQGNIDQLLLFSRRVRSCLDNQKITGKDGGVIDHIECFGPPESSHADSKNFVLCPGGEYDRSPCGTGTSAKVACLYAGGKLNPGEVFRQESIIGSIFEATFRLPHLDERQTLELQGTGPLERVVVPSIRGSAFVHGETTLVFGKNDPFRLGISK
jgi:4-hydroxyproline epimerase